MGRFRLSPSLFRRVTLSALLVSLLSTLALFAVVQRIVANDGRAMLTREIDTDLAGLIDIYVSGGVANLRARIADRLAVQRQDGEQAYYLLADGQGKTLAGNLERWPRINAGRSEALLVTLPDGAHMFARATGLGPGLRLLVGRSDLRGEALLGRLAAAFALAGVVVALFSLAVGHDAAQRLRRRVEGMNAIFADVRAGIHSARVGQAGDLGELSLLAANINATLDQVLRLIDAHRQVSDQTAHEIRTPLMHLDTRLWKAEERATDAELLRMLGQSRNEVRGVVRLLDSLLDIAGTQAMRDDPRGMEYVDLSGLAENLAELYGASADDLGIRFRSTIAPGIRMRADPMQMTRLLSNLLDNAFRYVSSGGSVSLSVDAGPVLIVKDDGPGIPSADRERVFDRYVRLGNSVPGGHGLGLALARAIAERHGLVIRIEDANPGALFVIRPEEVDV
ncbi:MAG: HAMP domain-containing sensor histidine kinase [Sphingobium sp.]